MSSSSDQHQKEKAITNSHKNRSFIDDVLKSNDEHAVKKLFEEYFYLHAKSNNRDRITWDELRFIVNEILQRSNNELMLSEATHLFYELYRSQYGSTRASKGEEKQLFPKKTKSEQELVKPKERIASRQNKK